MDYTILYAKHRQNTDSLSRTIFRNNYKKMVFFSFGEVKNFAEAEKSFISYFLFLIFFLCPSIF